MKITIVAVGIVTALLAACDTEPGPAAEREDDDIVVDGDLAPAKVSIVAAVDAPVHGTLKLAADGASGTLVSEDEDLEIELESSADQHSPTALPGDFEAPLHPQELPPADHGGCTICDAQCWQTEAGWVCITWNCKPLPC